MKTVNVHDAKTRFSSLLARIEESGESIVICRNGKPVAELVPHRPRRRTKPHPVLSRIEIDFDPTEDLSSSEWPRKHR